MTKSDSPRVYFLSTGRTGTTFIYNLIKNIYPEFSISHQTKRSREMNILGNLVIIKPSLSYLLLKGFNYLKKEKIPKSTVDPLLSIPIALFLLNSNQQFEYRIIHLVRDPRDFVSSFINWKNQRLRRIFLHHFVPFWQPNPVFCDNITLLQRIKMNKFEYFCWIWNFKNRFFANQFEDREYYHFVRLEDLSQEPESLNNLKKLFNFLGFPETHMNLSRLTTQKVNITTKKKFTTWKDWNKQKAKTLDKYCGELMRKYGYGMEDDWKSKLLS